VDRCEDIEVHPKTGQGLRRADQQRAARQLLRPDPPSHREGRRPHRRGVLLRGLRRRRPPDRLRLPRQPHVRRPRQPLGCHGYVLR
jgi:hypothetical protein